MFLRLALILFCSFLSLLLQEGLSCAETALTPDLRLTVARGLYNDGLYRLSIKELDLLEELENKVEFDCEVKLLLGKSRYALKEYSPVPEILKNVTARNCPIGMQEEAYFLTGSAYFKSGVTAPAREYLEKFLSSYPESPNVTEAQYSLGDLLYREGTRFFNERDYQKALDDFERVISFKSTPVPKEEILAKTGDSLFFLGRFNNAVKQYDELISILPKGEKKGRIRYQLALINFNTGKYEKAEKEMLSFIEKYPDHALVPDARSVVAWALFKNKKYDESLAYFEDILKTGKGDREKNARVLAGSASRLILLDEYMEAMSLLEDSLKQYGSDPMNGELMFTLAASYRAAGYSFMEEETYKEILKRYPSSPAAVKSLFELGKKNFDKGIYSDAVINFKGFIDSSPLTEKAGDAIYYSSESMFRLGRFEEAREGFLFLVANYKDSAFLFEASLRLADIYSVTGKYIEAGKSYLSLMDRFKDRVTKEDTIWKAAEAFRKGGDLKSAAKMYKSYIREYPHGLRSGEVVLLLADIDYMAGNYKKGVKALQEGLKQGGDSNAAPAIAFKLARGYMQADKKQDAVLILKEITQKYPESPEAASAHYLRGWILQNDGDREGANKSYSILLDKYAGSPLAEEALWQLAVNEYDMGNHPASLKLLIKFSKNFPESYHDSEEMQRKCYIALGKHKEALEVSRAFFEMNPARTVDIKKRYEEAMALFKVESFRDAIKSAQELFDRFPANILTAKLHVMAGEILLKGDDVDGASRHYSDALKFLPISGLKNLAHYRIAELAFRQKDYRGALSELDQVEASFPEDTDKRLGGEEFADIKYITAKSFYLRGEAAQILNLPEKGRESFTFFTENFTGLKGLDHEWLKAGLALQQYKDYEGAVKVFRYLVETSENQEIRAEAQYWTGESFQYQGRLEEAAVEYLKVTYLYPAQGMWALTARYMAAQVYQELGGYEEAIRLYEKVALESGDKRKSEYARKRIEELSARIATNDSEKKRER